MSTSRDYVERSGHFRGARTDRNDRLLAEVVVALATIEWPERRQQILKATAGTTRTEIVAAKFLEEFLITVNDSTASTHMRL